eukprot:1348782-Amorphochlora_amoeboformis.AAC.2
MSDTKNQDTTRIKVNYKGDIRRVAITSKEVDDFSKLLSRLEAVCEAQKTGIKIRYIDEDDDEVTILTSGEFKEALDWAKSEGVISYMCTISSNFISFKQRPVSIYDRFVDGLH